MRVSLSGSVRILVPPAVGIVGVILVLRHRPISLLELGFVLAVCSTWSVAAWMRSQILSEIFQSFWWGSLLVFSLKGDKSGGFYPMFCGGMFILSVHILRQAFQERGR